MADVFGIIGAMENEVRSLCAELDDLQKIEACGLVFNKGKLYGKDVIVVRSGVGKVNAALCVQALILKFGATKIINTGVAGATGANLEVFDFVVSTEAIYHDVDVRIFGYERGQVPGLKTIFTADQELVNLVEKAFKKTDFATKHKLVKGRIASGDQFIAEKTVKDDIIASFNPICVEMEGTAIAQASTLNKTPFVIIRCMSDCADVSIKSVYDFNEDVCAEMCAEFVKKIISEYN